MAKAKEWLDAPKERRREDRREWLNELAAWKHIVRNMEAVYGPLGA